MQFSSTGGKLFPKSSKSSDSHTSGLAHEITPVVVQNSLQLLNANQDRRIGE
jgi:hypothetical protein